MFREFQVHVSVGSIRFSIMKIAFLAGEIAVIGSDNILCTYIGREKCVVNKYALLVRELLILISSTPEKESSKLSLVQDMEKK